MSDKFDHWYKEKRGYYPASKNSPAYIEFAELSLAAAQQTIQQQAETILQQQAAFKKGFVLAFNSGCSYDRSHNPMTSKPPYIVANEIYERFLGGIDKQALANHDREKDEQIAMLRNKLYILCAAGDNLGNCEGGQDGIDFLREQILITEAALSATDATATEFMKKHDAELLEGVEKILDAYNQHIAANQVANMIDERKAKC
jgi:hypothetical protein